MEHQTMCTLRYIASYKVRIHLKYLQFDFYQMASQPASNESARIAHPSFVAIYDDFLSSEILMGRDSFFSSCVRVCVRA